VVAFLCAPARRPGHGVRRHPLPELAELPLHLHPDAVPEQVGRLARLMVLHLDREEQPPQASGAGDAIAQCMGVSSEDGRGMAVGAGEN